jgi:hypothetical protein
MPSNRFLFVLSSLAIFCLACSLRAQVGQRQRKPVSDDEFGSRLIAEATWAGQPLPGSWREISTLSELHVSELQVRPLVFGERAESIQASRRDGKLERLVVVYLEAGFFFADENVKRRDFATAFRQLEKSLPDALAEATGDRGRRFRQGQGTLASRGTEFRHGDLSLRLLCEDDQLVSLTIQPATAADRDYGADDLGSRQQRRRESGTRVEKLANGDVLIQGIPMSDQQNRSYCAMATLAMILQYHGLNLDVDTLAAKAGYREGNPPNANALDFYRSAAKLANLRVRDTRAFSLRDVKKSIDRGEPVIFWRQFSRSRDEFHSQFAARLEQEPQAELPNPKGKEGRADRRHWPDGKEGPGHASIITGYNEERGEVIFTESWGESYRNRRMRAEEAEATTLLLFFFSL